MNPESAFTHKAKEIWDAAAQNAKKSLNPEVAPVHIALALWNAGADDQQPYGSLNEGSWGNKKSLFVSVIQRAGGSNDILKFIRGSFGSLVGQLPQEPQLVKPCVSNAADEVLKKAQSIQKTMHDYYIAQDHLLLAVIEDPSIQTVIRNANLTEATLKTIINQIRGNLRVDTMNAEQNFDALSKYAVDLVAFAADGKIDPVIGRDDEISRVIHILSRRTKNTPVLIGESGVGKSAVVEGLAQRILKRDVPPSLLGRLLSLDLGALMAGAMYEGEYEERVKSVLQEAESVSEEGTGVILVIDQLHLVMAGSGPSSGGMDAANLLRPTLARGKLRCIGATTLAEYRQYIEKDPAFERRFTEVMVKEPSVPETITILGGIRDKYEVHHGVRILDGALISAATLAHRHLESRRLPDSAIDLVDEACASVRFTRETTPEDIDKLQRRKLELEADARTLAHSVSQDRLFRIKKAIAEIDDELQPLLQVYKRLKNLGDEINRFRKMVSELNAKAEGAERMYYLERASDIRFHRLPEIREKLEHLEQQRAAEGGGDDVVTPEKIAEIVGRWTSIPVARLTLSEEKKLLRLDKDLTDSVVGQPEAVTAVANAVRLSRSGLRNPDRPIASFLLTGLSGTGKTLLSETLATLLFDSPDAMIRIDSSEYSEKHSISRLIGAPPGYVGHDSGGQLTEYVRRKPYCIVLIHEVEKACREFQALFQQVLDNGKLTDGQGRLVDFRNALIIMTSKLGAVYLGDMGEGPVGSQTIARVMKEIRLHLAPEFINRIDEVVIFRVLSPRDMKSIVDIQLKETQARLAERGITLQVHKDAKKLLCDRGCSPTYGARFLYRTIQSDLLNPLAVMILQSDRVRDGTKIDVWAVLALDGSQKKLEITSNPHRQGTATHAHLGSNPRRNFTI